ncbi:hypothetical protein [Paenibacillus sp. Soil724D2]|uniref:hypothetical protein n=1 Tax=Paenibacillus sp. (strain Soil724D2) TaxID=1736392 RepID=UPI000A5B7E87|nr:hypothetical protein [Paenibacillus sp. Soil724D2]
MVNQTDKEWNAQYDFSYITDSYFREKLESGLIRYAPEDWTEMTPIEENELR